MASWIRCKVTDGGLRTEFPSPLTVSIEDTLIIRQFKDTKGIIRAYVKVIKEDPECLKEKPG
jgi:hypothetical protein